MPSLIAAKLSLSTRMPHHQGAFAKGLRWLTFGASLGFFLNATNAAANGSQYIKIVNKLQVPASTTANTTASAVILRFYNGASYACFTTWLDYGESVILTSGGQSPCVSPVQNMTVTPQASDINQVCYQSGSMTPVDAAFKNVSVSITQLTGPTFDTFTGALLTQGTAQLTITGS